jgi:cytochrome c553
MLAVCSRLFVAFAILIPSAAAMAAPFEDTIAQRTLACTSCHGDQGRAGPDGYYPRLAGKPAAYLYNQLLNFRDGKRSYPLMTGLLDSLSDSYLLEMAQYFSALDLPYPAPRPTAVDAATLARGKTLATQGDRVLGLPACTQCHGTRLTGTLPNVPALLGLPRDYINAQLGRWQTGQRRTAAPDCMAHIAKALSPADVSAVASWLSAQAVPAPAKAVPKPPAKDSARSDLACAKAP